jgi:hypothetical protein
VARFGRNTSQPKKCHLGVLGPACLTSSPCHLPTEAPHSASLPGQGGVESRGSEPEASGGDASGGSQAELAREVTPSVCSNAHGVAGNDFLSTAVNIQPILSTLHLYYRIQSCYCVYYTKPLYSTHKNTINLPEVRTAPLPCMLNLELLLYLGGLFSLFNAKSWKHLGGFSGKLQA